MGDQQHAREGARAELLHLEEARPRHESVAAQAAEQRGVAGVELKPGATGERDQLAGQVDEGAVAAVGPGGDNEPAAGAEQAAAAGEDLRERGGERGPRAQAALGWQVGEVERVAGVALVEGFDAVGVQAYLPVRGGAVRRRGEDQRNGAGELVEQAAAELAGVTAESERMTLCSLRVRVQDVAGSKCGPARLELDADRAPAEVDRLDQGGADAAHRVDDELARLAVGGDRAAGKLGQHLRRMRG